MIKRLTKTGNSLALVLERPLLESTHIDIDTDLEISSDGDVIIITPVRGNQRVKKFREGVESINRRYQGAFRRLAE